VGASLGSGATGFPAALGWSAAAEPAWLTLAVDARAGVTRAILEQRVNGQLTAAAAEEGIDEEEIALLCRRQARASLYLDKMIAPMLEPNELELRDLWRTGATPFKDQPFDEIKGALARWYVGRRLGQALEAYFQNARSRVVVAVARRAPR